MKVLTDTHTLVWAISNPDALGVRAREVLATSSVVASVANLWELVLKSSKPGALVADPLPWWTKYVTQAGIPALAIRTTHIQALAALPELHVASTHRDLFDRILVAQAIAEGLTLVSKDAVLARYGVPVIW